MKRFDYPEHFVTLPGYSAHRGQAVEVLRELVDGEEYDGPLAGLERMYRVRAADGWEGDAWESELSDNRS
jgi:hypothetical protein